MNCKLIFLLIMLAALRSCSPHEKVVFPGVQWLHMSPEEAGLDPRLFQEALDYLDQHCLEDGIRELVIVRNGYLVHAGPHADSVHNIWSCSKTFTSAVMGLLADEGRLHLDEAAAAHEPLLQDLYPELNFRHFATMTSGYSARGDSRWPDADYADWSWTPYAPESPYFAPGSAFAYWDEAQMMFGRVLTQVLGEPMHAYLSERITTPIGMGPWEWYPEGELHGVEINNGCTNVVLSALQLARWGHLFLMEGNWDGQQVLSREFVRQATSVQVPSSLPMGDTDRASTIGPGCYGFNWWVNGRMADGRMKLPGAPEGTFFASGLNNNKCLVIPDWNMVVVRMGQDGHPPDKDRVYGTFLQLMEQAMIW